MHAKYSCLLRTLYRELNYLPNVIIGERLRPASVAQKGTGTGSDTCERTVDLALRVRGAVGLLTHCLPTIVISYDVSLLQIC